VVTPILYIDGVPQYEVATAPREVPFVTVTGDWETNRTLQQLVGRKVTSVRMVEQCNGAKLIDGAEHWGSAFLLEVDDGKLKLALVPAFGGGFKFVLFHEEPIVR
jgi:hypothetical protein